MKTTMVILWFLHGRLQVCLDRVIKSRDVAVVSMRDPEDSNLGHYIFLSGEGYGFTSNLLHGLSGVFADTFYDLIEE